MDTIRTAGRVLFLLIVLAAGPPAPSAPPALSAPLTPSAPPGQTARSAQSVPPEVTGLRFDSATTLAWNGAAGARGYHIYSRRIADLPDYGVCLLGSIPGTGTEVAGAPPAGSALFYLVTSLDESGEGTAGTDSAGGARVPATACKPARRIFPLTTNGDGGDGVEDGIEPRRNPSVLARSSRRESAGVYLHTGEVFLHAVDLRITGRRTFDPQNPNTTDFIRFRSYRSQIRYDGPLGHGWDSNLNARLASLAGFVVLHDGTGRRDVFQPVPMSSFLVSPPGLYAVLRENIDGSFSLRWPDGTLHRFHALTGSSNVAGALESIEDRSGNAISLLYDYQGLLTTAVDSLGRAVQFEYDARGRLTSMTDFIGRTSVYSYDAEGNLVSARSPVVVGTPNGNDFPAGKTTTYTYSTGSADPRLDHNLLTVVAPSEQGTANAVLEFHYDDPVAAFDRVTSWDIGGTNQTGIAAGGTLTLGYQQLNPGGDPADRALPRRMATVLDRNGNSSDYLHNFAGNLIQRTDRTNREVRPGEPDYLALYEHDAEGELTRIVRPEGNETLFTYDSTGADRYRRGNLVEIRGRAGPRGDSRGGPLSDLVTTYTYDPIYNLVRTVTDPRGNDAAYLPQNGGPHSPQRYTWERLYDHQEGDPATHIAAYAAEWGIDATGLQAGRGDLNGDGRTDQIAGRCVRTQAPSVRLDAASNQAAIEGDTTQEIVSTFRYNDFGQIVGRTDPEGNVADYAYYAETDPDGDGTTTPAPPDGRTLDAATGGYLRIATLDSTPGADRNNRTNPPPTGLQHSFAWDAVGNLAGHTGGRGVLTARVHNALDQVVEVRRAAATADSAGPAGDPATGRGETGLAPFAFRIRYEYDANDNRTAVRVEDRGETRGLGPEIDTTYAYDILDRRVRVTEEATAARSLVTEHRYDPNENPIRLTEPEGNAHVWTYDERDLLHTATLGASGPRGGAASTASYEYDGNGRVVRVTDPRGHPADRAYDGFDRLVRITDPVGSTLDALYDPASRAVETLLRGPVAGPTPPDRSGSTNVDLVRTSFLRDEGNRLFRIDRGLFVPAGAATSRPPSLTEGPLVPGDGALNTVVEYDRLSRVSFVVKDTSAARRFDYDGLDRLVKLTEPDQSTAERFYDGASNPIERVATEKSSVAGPPDEEFVTTYDYDALGRLTRVVDSAGGTFRGVYDSLDRVVTATDARGPAGGVAHRKSPGRTGIGVAINAHGNVTRYAYDGLGRLLTRERVLTDSGAGDGSLSPAPDTSNTFNADGLIRTALDWDGNSLLSRITDDRGLETTYAYDNLDRRILTTYDDDTTTARAYDPAHNLSRLTDANGSLHDHTYDDANRLVRIDSTPAAGIEGTTLRTFEYDGRGRLTRARDNNDPADAADDATSVAVYDSLGRVIEEQQSLSDGTAVRMTGYHWQSRVINALIYPTGRRIDYGYDAAGRLVSVADPDPLRPESAAFEYFGLRRVHTRRLGNGVRTTMLNDAGTQDIGYDGLRRIVNLRHLGPAGGLLGGFEYVYDSMSNVVVERRRHHLRQGNPRGERYAYDSANRLIDFREGDLDPQDNLAGPPLDAWSFVLDGAGNWPEMTRNGETRRATPNNLNEYDEDQSGGTRTDDGVADDFGDLAGTPVPDGVNLAHNKKGDQTLNGAIETTYDALSRPIRATDTAVSSPIAEYRYDALGRRVRREVTNRGPLNEHLRYAYAGSRLVEERDPSGPGGRDLMVTPGSFGAPRSGADSSVTPQVAGVYAWALGHGDGNGSITTALIEFNTLAGGGTGSGMGSLLRGRGRDRDRDDDPIFFWTHGRAAENSGFESTAAEVLDPLAMTLPPEQGPPLLIINTLWQVHTDGSSQYLLEDGRGSTALLVDGAAPTPVERMTYDAWGKPQFEDPAGNPRLDGRGNFAPASGVDATELWRGMRYDPEYGDRTADLRTDRGGYYFVIYGDIVQDQNAILPVSHGGGEFDPAVELLSNAGASLAGPPPPGGHYNPNHGRPTTRLSITGGGSLDDDVVSQFAWRQTRGPSRGGFGQDLEESEFLFFLPARGRSIIDPNASPVDEVDDVFLLLGGGGFVDTRYDVGIELCLLGGDLEDGEQTIEAISLRGHVGGLGGLVGGLGDKLGGLAGSFGSFRNLGGGDPFALTGITDRPFQQRNLSTGGQRILAFELPGAASERTATGTTEYLEGGTLVPRKMPRYSP